ncbi:hypothetical protein CVT24_009681 [Panaeolus cyanescens]|uniref:Uncharacterized protein n=1 Tax=Panaeolus cyanescens TaxID=181874 RepID=A0A409Y9T2_9AGAR|nr:hypothetical protein CVT24_009681 [Panaeolus cyanescens]
MKVNVTLALIATLAATALAAPAPMPAEEVQQLTEAELAQLEEDFKFPSLSTIGKTLAKVGKKALEVATPVISGALTGGPAGAILGGVSGIVDAIGGDEPAPVDDDDVDVTTPSVPPPPPPPAALPVNKVPARTKGNVAINNKKPAVKIGGKVDRSLEGDDIEDSEAGRFIHQAEGDQESSGQRFGRGAISLQLDINEKAAVRSKSKDSLCFCCGFDCSLFWKIIAAVVGLTTLYYGYKAIAWVNAEGPIPGLERMPAFGTLSCPSSLPYTYNNSQIVHSAALSPNGDHAFDIRGEAIGLITLTDGEPEAEEVVYTFTVRGNRPDVAQDVYFVYSDLESDGKTVHRSRFIIDTSRMPRRAGEIEKDELERACQQFDVKIAVPPNLKRLHVLAHATAHIGFHDQAKIAAERLIITASTSDDRNVIRLSRSLMARNLELEVYRGWIIGDAPIVQETSVSTQRGNGTAHMTFYPVPLPGDAKNSKATLRTTTGAGRSYLSYVRDAKARHRLIDSEHLSSRNADIKLTYTKSGFNGLAELNVKESSDIQGAQALADSQDDTVHGGDDGLKRRASSQYTHYVGSQEGKDRLRVYSRGWVGAYF